MKKKILIIYAPLGNGYKSIASDIEHYIKEKDEYEVQVINILDYLSFYGKFMTKIFNYNLRHRKEYLSTLIYNFWNNKLTTISYKKTTQNLYSKKLMRKVVSFDPDLTISSHFFSSILMGCYKEKGITDSKIISIITDYTAHELVLKNQKFDDAIIVADEIVKNILTDKGVKEEKIKVYGLPVSGEHRLLAKETVLSKYVLDKQLPIFLMFGGGNYGCSSYYNFFKKLANEANDYQLIFTAGNNESFKNKCYKYIKTNKIKNVRVLGFIEEIQNLINVSDAVITNPNGTIITECISFKKPLILIPGYGGVELKNEKYLIKKGYAKRVNTKYGLKRIINKITDNPSVIEKLQSNLNKISKNNPLSDLYKLINHLLK